jgi:hypothetical protein
MSEVDDNTLPEPGRPGDIDSIQSEDQIREEITPARKQGGQKRKTSGGSRPTETKESRRRNTPKGK